MQDQLNDYDINVTFVGVMFGYVLKCYDMMKSILFICVYE